MNLFEGNPWIQVFQPQPEAKQRLICFPFAGGDVLTYRLWGQHLGPSTEVCMIQMPGRGMRFKEPLLRHLDPLIEALIENISPILTKNFFFFGHSLGGLIAYEFLCQFKSHLENNYLNGLVVSASKAPQWHQIPTNPYHKMNNEQFLEKLKSYEGIPEEVLAHTDLLEILLPITRADMEIFESYQMTKNIQLDCPIYALGGRQDKIVTEDKLHGWQERTKNKFQLKMFDGGHFYLNEPTDDFYHYLKIILS